jgi:hypothetical protein
MQDEFVASCLGSTVPRAAAEEITERTAIKAGFIINIGA